MIADTYTRCYKCPRPVRYMRRTVDKFIVEIVVKEENELPYYLITDFCKNNFRIEISNPGGSDYKQLVKLDYIPKDITPQNAHEWINRFLELKTFL